MRAKIRTLTGTQYKSSLNLPVCLLSDTVYWVKANISDNDQIGTVCNDSAIPNSLTAGLTR